MVRTIYHGGMLLAIKMSNVGTSYRIESVTYAIWVAEASGNGVRTCNMDERCCGRIMSITFPFPAMPETYAVIQKRKLYQSACQMEELMAITFSFSRIRWVHQQQHDLYKDSISRYRWNGKDEEGS